MEELWNSEQFAIFSKEKKPRVKHSGIGERLTKINPVFFQKIFEALASRFSDCLDNSKQKFNIMKFDSTLVGLSSRLINFGITPGTTKGNKSQIKYTIGVKNIVPQVGKIFIEQSAASEEKALKEVILASMDKADSIVVFDRGLQRRKTFVEFTYKGIQFVTRLKNKVRFKKLRIYKNVKGRRSPTLVLDQDVIVQLKDESEKFMQKEFRLITASSIKSGERLNFLTNITTLNAREITDIYRRRWEIEVFFRFIKQELNFKHFVSRSKNGMLVMLYMTLITALLLLVYKTQNQISGYKKAKLRFCLETVQKLYTRYDIGV
jgi:hypothetical protein